MATLDAVTLSEVKTALGIDGTTEDANLARLITATTLAIEARLGTQFVQRSVVEYHAGGSKRLYLQRTPIVSVTTIVDPRASAVASTQFVVRHQRFIEHWGTFPTAYATSGQPTDWTVTYVAGWYASTATVSADVKNEVLRCLGSVREAPSAGVSSVGVGDLSISYAAALVGGQSPALDSAATALYAYRGVLL